MSAIWFKSVYLNLNRLTIKGLKRPVKIGGELSCASSTKQPSAAYVKRLVMEDDAPVIYGLEFQV